MKKYKLILPLALSLIFGSITATAQNKDGGSQKDKPTKEKADKPAPEKPDKVGVSGGKSTEVIILLLFTSLHFKSS